MHYGNIKPCSTENGIGIRVSLFVSGCRNHCKGCFSEQTWNFTYGKEYTNDVKEKILKLLEPNYIAGITILGGEPMEPENQKDVLDLLKTIKENYPNKNIWMYSGFTFEEMMNENSNSRSKTKYVSQIISLLDVLVDGKFDIDLKNPCCRFRGSTNQRIINIQKTLEHFNKNSHIYTIELVDSLMTVNE